MNSQQGLTGRDRDIDEFIRQEKDKPGFKEMFKKFKRNFKEILKKFKEIVKKF